MNSSIFTFVEDDELLAYCDLTLVGAAEINWDYNVLSVNLIDAGIMQVWFKTQAQLKHEFLRLITSQQSFFDETQKELERAYTRH